MIAYRECLANAAGECYSADRDSVWKKTGCEKYATNKELSPDDQLVKEGLEAIGCAVCDPQSALQVSAAPLFATTSPLIASVIGIIIFA